MKKWDNDGVVVRSTVMMMLGVEDDQEPMDGYPSSVLQLTFQVLTSFRPDQGCKHHPTVIERHSPSMHA